MGSLPATKEEHTYINELTRDLKESTDRWMYAKQERIRITGADSLIGILQGYMDTTGNKILD